MNLDRQIDDFYEKVNDFWRKNQFDFLKKISVISIGGGSRDVLVPSHLTKLNGIVSAGESFEAGAPALPLVWASTDHLPYNLK